MSRSRIRFFLAQVSAFVVFFVTVGIVVLLLGRAIDLRSWVGERPTSAMEVLGFVGGVAAIGCIGILGMVLCGRFLVVIRLLTKEEARGYPYSKPWERRRDLF